MSPPRVAIPVPDLSPYREGNTGIPYVWSFDSGRPGPHVGINALIHGNELSGAWALVRLLELGLRPQRGRLGLSFANIEAFAHFDPDDPTASRFLEEDMNRLWRRELLEGPARTVELRRARELLPHYRSLDFLLDLHSMQTASPPLMLCGLTPKGRRFARRMGYPATVVADAGHPGGVRLIDFEAFGAPRRKPVAVLLEAGQHWAQGSIDVALAACLHFLRATEVLDPELAMRLAPTRSAGRQRFIEVTHAVTVRRGPFLFKERFRGLEVIEREGTVIATDGGEAVRTPYDHCVLIMPSRRLAPGLTAVRLGREVPPPRI